MCCSKKRHCWFKTVLLLLTALVSSNTFALSYALDPVTEIVGQSNVAQLHARQSLMQLGQRYNLSYYEVLEANPLVHPKLAEPGTLLIMPTEFILPEAPREGVVVNLAELRLYVYPEAGKEVITLPIGIGRYGWDTPIGEATIKDKRKNPKWHVPESVYQDMKRRGVIIPRVWPPGPKNPLGEYAMRISMPGYDIHGTNREDGVGRRTSAGCIRMYNSDVKEVFENVEVGTLVSIVNQPYKIGSKDNKIFLEAHMPLYEQYNQPDLDCFADAKKVVEHYMDTHNRAKIEWDKVKTVVEQFSGVPTQIGSLT